MTTHAKHADGFALCGTDWDDTDPQAVEFSLGGPTAASCPDCRNRAFWSWLRASEADTDNPDPDAWARATYFA